jgi:glutamine synthetase
VAKNAGDVLKLAKESGARMVDLKFVDLPGTWQHWTIPVEELKEDTFEEGLGFDGSSIRGFQRIEESDMLLLPDPTTAVLDPFFTVPTISLIGNVVDPLTRTPYSRDPRYIAAKAEAYLKKSGVADTTYMGPEAEFYVFDDVKYGQSAESGFYSVDSAEGAWNTGMNGGPNLGYKLRHKEGYFPVSPADTLSDLRTDMVLTLLNWGVPVEAHHHEVGTAGQCEIDLRFDTLTKMGDNLMTYKYVVRNVAKQAGKTVTFMPKPLYGDNGSGMHVHQSLWKGGKNLFFDKKGYAGLSQTACWYIGGLLRHAPALLGLCAPTTNSYRRLVPGFEAPVTLVYSQRNRSAAVRIPVYSTSEKSKRIEFRCPDPSANPYLCFAALLMAGLDGIKHKIEPGEAVEKDLYDLEPEEQARLKSTPGSLGEVLDALEADHAFLLEGDVFTPDVIESWIAYKRERELAPVNLRPVPYEFFLYYDV